ncbi:HTH domain-containing protein [Leptolyngbya ohadii]|uniref:HTH domain-containing protein n=1 Tax=Leptolyngbya ohadii TaxID=1962290 RepID=UPI000B59BC90|nr:HTH domain-containing protein [Leptolyngbya ohadii]
MNKTSTDKIKLATPFLIWFRCYLSIDLQAQVRPHLERPYQLALNILDSCEASRPLSVREIAERIGMSPETVRQVLLALKEGGMPFATCPGQGWQSVRAEGGLKTRSNSLVSSGEL